MSISNTTIQLFRNSADAKSIPAGSVIFQQGEPADFMYVVTEGQVNIVVGDTVVDQLGSGSIFGEMALVDNAPRSATAKADTDCKIVPVDKNRFVRLITGTPHFALQVMSIMAERLRYHMAATQTNNP